MAVLDTEARINASLDDIWELYSVADQRRKITPGFLFELKEIKGPDGDHGPEVLETGSTIAFKTWIDFDQPLVLRIVERERSDDEAMFREEMVQGSFPKWTHTHRFRTVGDETVVHDHVEYELPDKCWPTGQLIWPLAIRAMFLMRHKSVEQEFTSNFTLDIDDADIGIDL